MIKYIFILSFKWMYSIKMKQLFTNVIEIVSQESSNL